MSDAVQLSVSMLVSHSMEMSLPRINSSRLLTMPSTKSNSSEAQQTPNGVLVVLNSATPNPSSFTTSRLVTRTGWLDTP